MSSYATMSNTNVSYNNNLVYCLSSQVGKHMNHQWNEADEKVFLKADILPLMLILDAF